jgi:VWFA-related protein
VTGAHGLSQGNSLIALDDRNGSIDAQETRSNRMAAPSHCCSGLALTLILSSALFGQELTIHSRADLVVVPVSVTTRNHTGIEGLTAGDLILYDNDAPRMIHMDDVSAPISLAVVVQASGNAPYVLDKLRKEASLLQPLIAGDRGEAALIVFAGDVKVLKSFTSDFDSIAERLRNLDVLGAGAGVNDAVMQAIRLLSNRPTERRRVILLISEKHDRSSKSHVEEVIREAEKANVTIYPVTFSPSLTPYTTKALRECDPPGPEKKCKNCDRTCGMCARQCYRSDGKQHDPPTMPGDSGMNLLAALVELKRLADTDLAAAFARSTGGMPTGFLRKQGLEKALERIGSDLHTQYMLSFQPDAETPAGFHSIRVEVKGKPDLVVRARSGYWKSPN